MPVNRFEDTCGVAIELGAIVGKVIADGIDRAFLEATRDEDPD